MNLVAVAIGLMGLSLSACVISESGGEVSEDGLAETEQFLKPNCDDLGCGTNNPHLQNRGFHFLYANGAANPEGYSIASFQKPSSNTNYGFSVLDGEIRATLNLGSWGTIIAASGGNVVGMRLHINERGLPKHVITITGYDRIKSWATKSDSTRFDVPIYTFHWVDENGIRQNLCSHPENGEETLGMNEYFTLLFEGDQINAKTKTVSSAINNSVINFACAGSALAKLHLTGYTEVAKRKSFTTTAPERQAMLKMLTGSYCPPDPATNEATAYTIGGQPLYWGEKHLWNQPLGSGPREAQWNANGATCLNTPRLLANPSPDALLYWPEITQRSDIPCASSLPACPNTSSLLPDSPLTAVSVNPPPS
jgi:hypothetical protein